MRAFASRSPAFWAALAALAAIALYLPAIGYGLLYDSAAQVGFDPFIHDPAHWRDVLSLRVLGMDVLDFNRPANLASLMLDSTLWGRNPGGYHLTNLLLHGAVVALLFGWIRTFTGRTGPAFFAVLAFAAHPLLCETVVEIGYREDLLATLFILAGLGLAARFHPGRNGSVWVGGAIVAAFFLAVAAKESGVAGPAALAVYWALFRRGEGRGWLVLLGASALACGAFLAARFWLEPRHSVIFTEPPTRIAPGWLDFGKTQCRIWTAEFLRIVWPAGLCADYTPQSIAPIGWRTGVGVVFAVALAHGFLAWRSRRLALAVALFWFALLPVSNFIPLYRPMADRFLYLPMTAAALALAVGWARAEAFCRGNFPGGPAVLRVAGLGLIALLASRTVAEEAVWKDGLTLWKETVKRNPGSYTGWINLGWALCEVRLYEDAVEPIQRAASLSGGKAAEPYACFALVADALGRPAKAAEALARAAKADPRYADPDSLVTALTLSPADAARLKLIALRSSRL